MPIDNSLLRTSQLAEKDARPVRTSIRERSYSDEVITPESAITSSAVIAIITVMSQDLASIPLLLYRRRGRAKFRAYDNAYYRLMHDQPNPEHTSMIFRELLVGHLIAWGNFFAQKITDKAGDVAELWPLRPDRMQVKRVNGERIYLYTQSDGKPRVFLQEEILHIPALGFDGLVGYSRIALARNAIGLTISTEKFGSKFFSNDAKPGYLYKHPGHLGDEAYNRLKDSLDERKGVENSNKSIILEEGMDVAKIGIPNDDAQFLETRNFQIAEINRILGPVPPHRIADLDRSTSWGSGIDSQEQGYVNHVLLPYGVRIEQILNSAVLLERDRADGLFYEHLFDAFLRGDITTRFGAYQTGIINGVMSPNEAREKENLNPYKGGDVFWRPLNMAAVNDPTADNTGASAALEPLWTDAIARVLKRESNDLLGAAKRYQAKGLQAEYTNWLNQFYGVDHPAFVKKQFGPLLDAESRLFGIDRHKEVQAFISEFLFDRIEQSLALTHETLSATLDQYVESATQKIMNFISDGRNTLRPYEEIEADNDFE